MTVDPPIDGRDIASLLTGQTGAETPYDRFFYHVRHGRLAGVREGNWKLLIDVETRPWSHEGEALYNLENDPGESENLAARHPEIVGKLKESLEEFRRDLERQGFHAD